jgi:hypothetical protein
MKPFEDFKRFTIESLIDKYEINKQYGEAGLKQKNLYASPSGYLEWDTQLKICFAAGTSYVGIESYKAKDVLTIKVGELARNAIFQMAPPRYLSKELCEAFMQTPVPELTKDILEVLPFMHIMLPRNFVFDHYNDEVVSLVVKTGEMYPDATDEDWEMSQDMCKKLFPGAAITPKEIRGSCGIQIVTITSEGCNFWQQFIDEHAKSWHNENVKYTEKSGYEYDATERIIRIVINSLLVHIYEPELITKDLRVPTKGVGFGRKPGRQPIGPTWIGRGFRYERDRQGPSQGQRKTSGAVRAHWRRGHWHSYLVNKGKTDRIVKWVKPVYVKGCA